MAVQFNQNYAESTHTCVYKSSAVVPHPPASGLTFVCWFNVPSFSVATYLMSIYSTTFYRHGFHLGLWGYNQGNLVVASNTFFAGTSKAFTADAYGFDAWHMAAGSFSLANGCRVSLDGQDWVVGDGVIDRDLIDETTVGGFRTGTFSEWPWACAGCISRALIYNRDLTSQEIADLYSGAQQPDDISGLVTWLELTDAATADQESSVPETWSINIAPGSDGLETCLTSPAEPEETAEADTLCGSEDEADEALPAITWPKCILVPSDILVQVVSPTVSPGRSFTCVEKIVKPDAGHWRIELQNISIRDRSDVLQWRDIESQLNGTVGAILVPLYEAKLSDEAIAAISVNPAGIGDMQIEISQTAGTDIEAGMHFSSGEWAYRLTKLISTSGSGGDESSIFSIWPPLRSPIELGGELDFNDPHVRCRLEADDGMDMTLGILRYSDPTVAFVEDV